MRTNFFSGLLSTLFNRRQDRSKMLDGRPIGQLCDALLTVTGEVSGLKTAQDILATYASLESASKVAFFEYLNDKLDLDVSQLKECTENYSQSPTAENLKALHDAAEPARQELFRRLNQAPGATAALVSMRLDLLSQLKNHPDLARTDHDLTHLLSSWFNRGFLVLRRINWETPANILEKIIEYEAVHAINDWDDLRRRLQPEDRRCFAFFHPSMSDDPLIFVEVALSKGIPNSIQDVLAEERSVVDPQSIDTAVFYSISNCQGGLRGISLGNSLIKQVVQDLSWELPKLKTFVTLSPIPKLNSWLESIRDSDPAADRILSVADRAAGNGGSTEIKDIANDIRYYAAKYLVEEKRIGGLPKDSVARFHLGNGAIMHDVHALADMSENGLSQSSSAMVNYLYELDRVEQNHEEFVTFGKIATTRPIQGILNNGSQTRKNRRESNGQSTH